ncbi:MAG TPA: beta-N-acetylhexosaminidase, partial [Pyrinomonadaceae bacterium]|nr:beta-N-acetylhexosaminidase [Pyrinomonadaceae bacterium]
MPRTETGTLLRYLAVLCIALVINAPGARSQTAESPNALRLIPQPKQAASTTEVFRLGRNARVALADPLSADDRFAAQDFADDLRETAGVTVRIGKGGGRRTILIGSLDLAPVRAALRRAGLSVPPDLHHEGYLLGATEREVVVAGRSPAGVFYGMQTLKQLVRGESAEAYIQGVRITDWPTMRWRAISDDISRGPIPTLEYIKRQLRTFAAFKLNMHSFYMEHTFASREHPLIGPKGGSLTPEEIRELVAYARRYHLELVPEQQTFGHLHKVLRLEKYSELGEIPHGDVLSPQQEGAYKLIADLYRELDELFPGKFFHIGADETFELGEGQSRQAVRERGVGAVYFEHLGRVREILKPYNRQLMFWGDIALNHPDLLDRIPRDMIVMNWNYDPRETFTPLINPFKEAGLEQFVCPG